MRKQAVRYLFFQSSRLWFGFGCAIITVLLYWRRPDAFTNPQFWAEDGSRFFTTAFFWGWRSFTNSFAGYYHTLSRAAAYVGSWLPPQYAPHLYVFASWVLLVSIAAYIYHHRIPGSTIQKFLMVLALVATTADNEVFFSVANWVTVTVLLWVLLLISAEPESRLARLADVTLLLVAGLSSPFVICLWLLFFLRWWLRRTYHSLLLAGLSIIVAVVQFWNMPDRLALNGVPLTADPLFLDVIVYRFGALFLGQIVDGVMLTPLLRITGLILVVGFYGGFLWAGLRRPNEPVLFVVAAGLLCALLSLYVMKHDLRYMAHWYGRHYYIPAVTTAWALLLSTFKPAILRWAPLGLSFAAFLFWTPASKNQVFVDLDWAGQVAQCTGTQPLCKIPINPVWDPPVWFARMSSRQYTQPVAEHSYAAHFGDVIELVGYDIEQNAEQIVFRPVWRALQDIPADYKTFVHLFSPEQPRQILSQADQVPLGWTYPTSSWKAGEYVVDSLTLPTTVLPPGRYHIGIGWYEPASPLLDRLPLTIADRLSADNILVLPLEIHLPVPSTEGAQG